MNILVCPASFSVLKTYIDTKINSVFTNDRFPPIGKQTKCF